ncbi:MAG: ATP-binding cassette domain-containing protein, partial [Xanthobacteraceae bacterium]
MVLRDAVLRNAPQHEAEHTSSRGRRGGLMDILTVEGLSKSFGAVRALRDVSLSLRAGEIRAICGENGAGKSTLVKSLMGIFTPDAGSIAIDGVRQTMRGPQYAQALGLGLVAQELSLAPRLSVLDNIWLGSSEVPVFHRRPALRRRARDDASHGDDETAERRRFQARYCRARRAEAPGSVPGRQGPGPAPVPAGGSAWCGA